MLEVRLLGRFEMRLDDEPVALKSRPARALLAFLLLHPNTPHPRDKLAGLLWPDATEANARRSLRQALWAARKALGPAGERCLRVEDSAVEFDARSDIQLDTQRLEAATAEDAPAADLLAAAEVYEGELLPGMYEDWVVLERERLQAAFERGMGLLLLRLQEAGRWPEVLDWAERWIALGQTPEPAYRALMHAHTALGDRASAAAAFQRCCEALQRELGVEPSAETVAAFHAIQAAEPDAPPTAPIEPPLPAFLTNEAEPKFEVRAQFVGRARELKRLDEELEAALGGLGRLVFVVGEAGRGKSALMSEFAHRAMAAHDDLIAASGNCNAFSGAGDPYLPFRDVISMLGGEVEARHAAGAISREHARRLWRLSPDTAQALAETAPDLISAFMPAAWLRRWAAAEGPQSAGWLHRLQSLADRDRAQPGDLGQSQLFEQCTDLLRDLAARHPLLIILDDLQWADSASVNLLFHLGRRLAGSRILVLGAYRYSDVALGRLAGDAGPAQAHPLKPVIDELTRQLGDIHLDLDRAMAAEGRAFVDALLDSEPNRLDKAFRAALLQRTGGQALFTVELLRDMRARGDLMQDENERWVQRAGLDWSTLPARVEAVIEQRLERLDAGLRDLLSTASVEGEQFTAQVVARVQNADEREVLRRLARELERRHGLVRESGEMTAGGRRLARFQFSHVLFQQYLYDQLGGGERRLLHGEVGQALEALFAEDLEGVTSSLARHYAEAAAGEKAIHYSLQAGDRARTLYAHQEAIAHYRRALAFLKETGEEERAARTQMKLGLTYSQAFDFEQAREAYAEGFRLWQRVGERPVGGLPPVPHTLRINWPDPETLDPARTGITYSALLAGQLFSGLVTITPELDVAPDVAKSWEVLDGGRKYLFHLREDARWSDDRPVTAGDFEFAWKRALDPATGAFYAALLHDVRGARAFNAGKTNDPNRVGVQAMDDRTLAVELEVPAAYFIQLVASPPTFPVPRHVVQAHGQAWATVENIVTNGPFRPTTWQAGKKLILERNPLYHGRRGNATRLELDLVADPSHLLSAYEAGRLDVLNLWRLPPHTVNRARQRHANEYVSGPLLQSYCLLFNTKRPPFDDRRVRRALVLATDRASIAEVDMHGIFQPASGGFVPPGMPGHVPDGALPTDVEQARRLLAEAGYEGGQTIPTIEALVVQGREAQCKALLTQWRERLGIESTLKVEQAGSYPQWQTALASLEDAPPHVYFGQYTSAYPDPDNFLRGFVALFRSFMGWPNETYDSLIEQARRSTDQKERMRLYRQAEQILVDEAPLFPVTYGRLHLLLKPQVTNYPMSRLMRQLWKDIVLEPLDRPAPERPSLDTLSTLRTNWRDPDTLDPCLPQTIWSVGLAAQLFSGLATLSPELDVVPAVARSWETLDGGRRYVFHLRDDVRWSDGRPVTAHDFEYSWKRTLDPAMEAGFPALLLYDVQGARAFHQGEISDPNQIGVYARDDTTLVVELEVPAAYFIQLAAFPTTFPVPRWAVEAHGPDWAQPGNIITNGPFLVTDWQAGWTMTLRRNPDYFGRWGNVERLELTLNEEPGALLASYEKGALDVLHLWFLPPEVMDRARHRYAAEYLSGPQLLTNYTLFDTTRPPFSDRRIRQALALAADSERLANVEMRGSLYPATGGLVPPGMPGHVPGVARPPDLEQARRLLAEAGYPEGQGFPAVDILVSLGREYLFKPWAAHWRETLGLPIAVRGLPLADFVELMKRRSAVCCAGLWVADYPDPDCFLRVCVEDDRPLVGWRDEAYNELIENARRLTDQAERARLYRQAEQILAEQVPILPLTYGRVHVLTKPWVKNFRLPMMKQQFWKDILLQPH